MSAIRPSEYMRATDRRVPDPWGLNSDAGMFDLRIGAVENQIEAADSALVAVERLVAVCAGLPALEAVDLPEVQARVPDQELSGWGVWFGELHQRVERYAEVTPELVRDVLAATVIDGERHFELACHWALTAEAVAVVGCAKHFIVKHRWKQSGWPGARTLVELAQGYWKQLPLNVAKPLLSAAMDVAVLDAIPLLDDVIAAPPGTRRFLDPDPSLEVDGLRAHARKLRESALIMAGREDRG